MSSRGRLRRYIPFVVGLLLVAAGFWQQQNIRDWVQLYGYNAPTPVVQLADDVQLTPQARRLFYVNHPAMQDRSSFNVSCSSRGEHTIILGCYHPVDRGIYVFNVTDSRLQGIDQVTVAHEMLHAGYDRLSSRERSRVDAMLLNFYNTRLTDQRIKSVIDTYRKTEPNDVTNEMHSVFGTEVGTLTPELETYYKRYFIDRAKVVQYASDYQAEFTTRQNQVTAYDTQLETMKNQIDSNNAQLKTQEVQITAFRKQMDAKRSSGDIAAYNNNVPIYNRQIDAYNALIIKTRNLISSYNQLVVTRNQLALQVTDLAHSIDSSYQQINQ